MRGMRSFNIVVTSLVLAVSAWGLAGCGGGQPAKKTAGTEKGHDEEHGHHHHHHGEKGPHEGALVALGDEAAHLEVVFDAESGKLTAYVLDAEAKGAVHVTQPSIELAIILGGKEEAKKGTVSDPIVVTLAAVMPSDKGEATEFSAEVEALKGAKEFDAVLTSLTISGKEFKETKFNYPKGNEHEH